MNKFIKLNLIIGTTLLASCVASMSPLEVNNTLPTLTKSRFITHAKAQESIEANSCKYLVKGRKYIAPIGFTTRDDLYNGARGIDEWVILDGGNAYVLTNYNWVTVDKDGTTQLIIEFDTMKCE